MDGQLCAKTTLLSRQELKLYSGADKSLAWPGRKQATFPTFCGTCRFITTFTIVHYLSLR